MTHSMKQLDVLKQDVYRRIQIAAAVHLIKTTPKGKSPEAHALDIQQKLKLKWLNSVSSIQEGHCSNNYIDEHILRQQQDALKSQLHSVVSLNNQLFEDNSLCPEETSITREKCFPIEASLQFQDFNRDRRDIQANANFIQAIIHLKALAETHSIIPIQQYVSTVSKMSNRSKVLPSDHAKTKSEMELASSNDSGFCHIEGCHSNAATPQGTKSSNVASSMLLYIISSCNGNQLLEKSIQAILNQFRKIASKNEIAWRASNLHEVIDQWTGSIHQQALTILKGIVDEQPNIADAPASIGSMCLALIREITDIIINGNTPNEISYQTKENQILIVLQLLDGKYFWLPTLELIFNNLADLTARIKSGDKYQDETKRICNSETGGLICEMHREIEILDRCFFLLKLLKSSLTSQNLKLKQEQIAASEFQPKVSQRGQNSVAGLWRKHYEIHNVKLVDNSSTPHRLEPINSNFRQWKKILEDLFQGTLHKHPLIAVIIYDCVQMLPSLQ